MTMTMPNFLIIGTAKAATTSLYEYLNQHPEIYMSPVKEPRFFAFENEDLDYCGPGDETRNTTTITRLEDYQALFDGVANEKAIGEASPPYIYIPKAAERIRHHIPDAKLIAILRNPADRAFSNFMHHRGLGYEPCADFADAVAEEEARIAKNWSFVWHYVRRGYYYDQLKRYFDQFPRENIKIIIFEEFLRNKEGSLKEIFGFLNVDETFSPNLSVQHNPSGEPKSKFILRLFRDASLIKEAAKFFVPKSFRADLKRRLMAKNTARRTLSPEMRRQLMAKYSEDIRNLETLLGRDLSVWR